MLANNATTMNHHYFFNVCKQTNKLFIDILVKTRTKHKKFTIITTKTQKQHNFIKQENIFANKHDLFTYQLHAFKCFVFLCDK